MGIDNPIKGGYDKKIIGNEAHSKKVRNPLNNVGEQIGKKKHEISSPIKNLKLG